MNREDFDRLSLDQLKAEASKYGLPIARDKRRLIDSIMDHLESNAPVREIFGRTTSEPASTRTLRQEVSEEGNPELHGTPVSLNQVMIVVQQQINQLLRALEGQSRENPVAISGARVMENPSPDPVNTMRSSPSTETERQSMATWTPNGAVQALASQIPEYVGQEEDNIQVWVRRIDKVAQVHGASDGVTLLAASSRPRQHVAGFISKPTKW